jgi:hypothetical protein
MTRRSIPASLVFSIVCAGLLAGCAAARVQPDAFGASKSYAIVSVIASPEAYASSPTGGTVSGLVKAGSKNAGYSQDAKALLKDSLPIVIRELEKSPRFRLLAAEKVLPSKAYKQAKGDTPKVLWTQLLLADGYKYFAQEEELGRLAKALRVDGVIIVSLTYQVGNSGVNLFGLLSLGTQRGTTHLAVTAVDQTGQVVWRDTVKGRSDDSIGAIGESANFVKLHPLFLNATEHAVTTLVARLDQRL